MKTCPTCEKAELEFFVNKFEKNSNYYVCKFCDDIFSEEFVEKTNNQIENCQNKQKHQSSIYNFMNMGNSH